MKQLLRVTLIAALLPLPAAADILPPSGDGSGGGLTCTGCSTGTIAAVSGAGALGNSPLSVSGGNVTDSGTFAASNLALGGVLTTGGAVTLAGAYGFTGTLTGATSLTFPTSGTLATTAELGTGGPWNLYPSAIASGGGTEGSPWTDSDNTGGLQTEINSLAGTRGGLVTLAPGRFNLSTGATVTTAGVVVSGQAAGFPNDPNSEAEGTTATKLHLTTSTGNFFTIGGASFGARTGGNQLLGIGMWGGGTGIGSSPYTSNACVLMQHTALFRAANLNINNCGVAVHFGVSSSTQDAAMWNGLALFGNGIGVQVDPTVNWNYNTLLGSQISDNADWGLNAPAPSPPIGDKQMVSGNTLLRDCSDSTNCTTDPADIAWGRDDSIIIGNIIGLAGNDIGGPTNTADGLVIRGNRNTVTANTVFGQNQTGECGIRVYGNDNTIVGNSLSLNTTDICVMSGATGTVIYQPGAVVSDSGTGTIVDAPWNVSGSDAYRASGKVGIGGTPSDTLDVFTSASAPVARFNNSNTAGSWISLNASATGGHDWRPVSTANAAAEGGGKFILTDQTATADRLTIDGSGHLGIGTTAPSQLATLAVGGALAWDNSGTADTGLSRCSANVTCVGNGTPANAGGTLQAGEIHVVAGGGSTPLALYESNSSYGGFKLNAPSGNGTFVEFDENSTKEASIGWDGVASSDCLELSSATKITFDAPGGSGITLDYGKTNASKWTFAAEILIPSLPTGTPATNACFDSGGGLISSSSLCAGAAAAGTLTGSTLASGVTASSLTSVGTITSGTWHGTALTASYLPSDTAYVDAANIFTKGQAVTPVTVGSGTCTGSYTLTPDGTSANDYVMTCAASAAITIANPSTVTPGYSLTFRIKQPASGSPATLSAVGSDYLFAGGTLPTLTTANNGIDVIACRALTTSEIDCGAPILNVSNP